MTEPLTTGPAPDREARSARRFLTRAAVSLVTVVPLVSIALAVLGLLGPGYDTNTTLAVVHYTNLAQTLTGTWPALTSGALLAAMLFWPGAVVKHGVGPAPLTWLCLLGLLYVPVLALPTFFGVAFLVWCRQLDRFPGRRPRDWKDAVAGSGGDLVSGAVALVLAGATVPVTLFYAEYGSVTWTTVTRVLPVVMVAVLLWLLLLGRRWWSATLATATIPCAAFVLLYVAYVTVEEPRWLPNERVTTADDLVYEGQVLGVDDTGVVLLLRTGRVEVLPTAVVADRAFCPLSDRLPLTAAGLVNSWDDFRRHQQFSAFDPAYAEARMVLLGWTEPVCGPGGDARVTTRPYSGTTT